MADEPSATEDAEALGRQPSEDDEGASLGGSRPSSGRPGSAQLERRGSGARSAAARRGSFSRRSSGGSKGFSTEELQGAGPLTDFLCRHAAGLLKRPVVSLTNKPNQDVKAPELLRLAEQTPLQDIVEFPAATVMLLKERLKDGLMESITVESKLRGMYEARPPSTLKFWATHIMNMKKKVKSFNVEVTNRIFMYNLMNRYVPDAKEDAAERIVRTREFWNSYHDAHRYSRVPAQSDVGAPAWAGWRKGQSRMGPKAVPGKPLQAMPKPPTKHRFGMVWNSVQKRMTWEVTDPAPGSLYEDVLGAPADSDSNARPASGVEVKARRRGEQMKDRSSALPSIYAGRHRYFKECERRHNAPLPLEFTSGHSVRLEAAGRNLVDDELEAVAGTMTQLTSIEWVDLSGNSRLTDKGVVPFLEGLNASITLRRTLRRLDLSGLNLINESSIRAVERIVIDAKDLLELDLAGVPLPIGCQLPLCDAIGKHPKIQTVILSNTHLGITTFTEHWSPLVMASKSITKLDVSWNSLNTTVFLELGIELMKSSNVCSLNVANCNGLHSVGDADTPIAYFFETCARDSSLTYLDASINRIDFRTALVIEDSLDSHEQLAKLDLAGNPLGVGGMRSILRLLARNHTGLVHFICEDCFTGVTGDQESKVGTTLNYTNPGGKYVLDLSKPSHRSVLRTLYKSVEAFNVNFEDAFKDIPKSCNFTHASKDSYGLYDVPKSGKLSFNFDVSKFLEVTGKGVGDSDFPSMLRQHYMAIRFSPGFKKIIPLFAVWKQLVLYEDEQIVFLKALSKDFNLTASDVEHMMRSIPGATLPIIEYLMTSFPEDQASRWLVQMFIPSLDSFTGMSRRIISFLECNVYNPTGHYKLDLSLPGDFAVAERLMLIDRWEAAVDKRLERFDCSARGNGSHVRNELYQCRPLRCTSVAEWTVPETGTLEFDYCSSARTPTDAQVLSDALWENILIMIHTSPLEPDNKIKVLRSISHNFYITSMHMRQMIGFFRAEEHRAEAFIIFYLRIVDMYNAKVFRVRFVNLEEIIQLQVRCGFATFFPFLQPENSVFDLDLSKWDQRLCASMYVALCSKESSQNIRNVDGGPRPEYIHEDGTVDPLTLGVPRSWATFSNVPKGGKFRGKYTCAPEYRKVEFRKQLAEKYGYFDLSQVYDHDVLWWTGLAEAPETVMDFLEFLMGSFESVDAAFKAIDGPDGNGVITLKEFREGIDEIGCTKFEDGNKMEQVASVFRYLDPGGEGSVSLEEFLILDQLWREVDLSMREFVQFLFLSYEDLEDAWANLDDDGGGELDFDEFLEAVSKIGYFGPAAIVFNLLDNTDDGSISIEEFKVLEKYAPKKTEDAGLGSRAASKQRVGSNSPSRAASKQATGE